MFTEGKPEGKGEKPQDTQSSGVHLSAAASAVNLSSFNMTFWSLFCSAVFWLCAAYANIILLLRTLSRQADADLVKPLIAVAVTLDPVYLKMTRRDTINFHFVHLNFSYTGT